MFFSVLTLDHSILDDTFNVIFQGDVTLAEGVTIGANCIIGTNNKQTMISANTVVNPNSIIEEGFIGQDCQIGPYARIRPGTVLESRAKVGNFVHFAQKTTKKQQMLKNDVF